MIVPALLAALAAGTAVLLPGRPDRIARLLPPPPPPPELGPSPALVRGAAVVAGVALWWFVGGLVGAALGGLCALAGPGLVGRLSNEQTAEDEVAGELPLALDLLAACLLGGARTCSAIEAVAAAVPGALGDRLARVAAGLAVGSPPAEAWRALGTGSCPAGVAARALARAAEGGASVAPSVARVAADARRESLARSERAARRAGVLAVGPLGLCFLPAFLLLGVVPAVIGLAAPLLASL